MPTRETNLHAEHFASKRAFLTWCLTGAAGYLALFLALSFTHIFSPGLQVKDLADRDLVAPADSRIIDQAATDKLMEDVRQTVIPVFQVDRSRDDNTHSQVFRAIKRIQALQKAGLTPAPVIAKTADKPRSKATKTKIANNKPTQSSIEQHIPVEIELRLLLQSDDDFKKAVDSGAFKDLALTASQIERIEQRRAILHKVGTDEMAETEVLTALLIQPKDLDEFANTLVDTTKRLTLKFPRFPVADKKIWEGIVEEFLPEKMSFLEKRAAASIIAHNLEANLVIDHESTRLKEESAVKSVQPVLRQINQGEVIVSRGSLVTNEKLALLQALGITHIDRWPFIFSIAISLGTALALIGFFLLAFEPKHFVNATDIGLMFTVAVVTTATASIVGKIYPQFVPLPAMALILAIFFGRGIALAVTLPLILIIGVDKLCEAHNLVAYLVASIAAIFSYNKNRNGMITTGIFIAISMTAADLMVILISHLMSPASQLSISALGRTATLDLLGGLCSSIIAIGSLPFLENLFGMITPFRLAELTDANQPLLRRLEENAPGTYQHSLAVANLAEAGAKAISADANLVRAGALYHDIGKMVRPKYFIENQLGATNPHDSMSPEDSRARVLAHVTDGIALAQKYQLPKAIQDFIPMHQGTTLMAYFYHKACLRDGQEKVDAGFYRYPGPKPNTKETAIVMLADVSEAVTHSMRDPSQEEVEIALAKVFQNRWDDGQFADTNMTYDEMTKVREGFCRVWRTLHHERLKYPATTTGKMPIAPEEEKEDSKPKEQNSTGGDNGIEPSCC
ncbi:MAG: HDIG domain-containing protein [Candidatus Melainabacteria bacterium]|nr:HDIG domain-containing protein [Candidatus Melainabacteria bacterium]